MTRRKRTSIALPPELRVRVEALAKEEQRSVSQTIARLLVDGFDRRELARGFDDGADAPLFCQGDE